MAPGKINLREPQELSGSRATVLVVDDNPDNLLLLEGILGGAGYRILKAQSSEKAWELLRRERIDLIICDVMMPEVSGYDFCQLLRADPHLKDLPFVLITSKRLEVGDAVLGMEIGADDYLTRPIDHRLLLKKINLLLRRKHQREILEERIEQQEERLRSLVSFTNMIVHDMRNPLQVAMGYLDLLLQEDLKARHRRWLSLVYEVLDRQRQFLEDLLILAATREGRLRLELKSFDPRELIEELITFYQPQAQEQRRRIIFEDFTEGDEILSDRHLLHRVIDNLLGNAMKYGHGDVCLRLERARGSELIKDLPQGVLISVFNHARPIPQELQKAVFEPFVQLCSRGKKGGMGLGLYFCRLVLEALGGKLGLISPAPGRDEGVIFYVFLPQESS
ncbi:hybrid sensor histidine kinase/response regulator [Thermosulfuriphilus sp.]